MNTRIVQIIYTRLKLEQELLEAEILATPSGELSNALTDANIHLYEVQTILRRVIV